MTFGGFEICMAIFEHLWSRFIRLSSVIQPSRFAHSSAPNTSLDLCNEGCIFIFFQVRRYV